MQYQHQIFKCRVKATLSLFGGILFCILYMYFACGGRELLIPCCWHVDGLQELVLFVGPETNSGSQTWWQAPSPAEPSRWPLPFLLL